MAVRVRAHGWIGYFKVGWNWLDFFLAMMSVVDVWIIRLVKLIFGDQGLPSFRIVSVLRLLRLLRLARLVRLIRMFKELWLVVQGLAESCKVLFWVIILLFLVIYTFGIFMTVMVGGECDDMPNFPNCRDMFYHVPGSMITMFQIMSGDSWSMEVGRKLVYEYPIEYWRPLFAFVLIFFIFLTTFGLMNIVMAIIVENTLSAAKDNEDLERRRREKREKRVLEQLRGVFIQADQQGNANGMMDIDEFTEMCKMPEAEAKLRFLNVPTENPKDVFELFEQDDDGEVSMDDFFAGINKIKGEASARDMMQLVMGAGTTTRRVETVDTILAKMSVTLRTLPDTTAELIRRRVRK